MRRVSLAPAAVGGPARLLALAARDLLGAGVDGDLAGQLAPLAAGVAPADGQGVVEIEGSARSGSRPARPRSAPRRAAAAESARCRPGRRRPGPRSRRRRRPGRRSPRRSSWRTRPGWFRRRTGRQRSSAAAARIELGVVGTAGLDHEAAARSRRVVGRRLWRVHHGQGDAESRDQGQGGAAAQQHASIFEKFHVPWLRRADDAFKSGGAPSQIRGADRD